MNIDLFYICSLQLFKLISYYKTVLLIGSITSRGSNHLPHDSRYDVLPTTLMKGCSYCQGEMIYEKCGDNRVQYCTRSSYLFSW